MDIDATLRPRIPREHEVESDVRQKCVMCCGAYCAAWVGAGAFLFHAPCAFVATQYRARTVLQFIDKYGFIPLPLMATTFVHQIFMSTALWSPRQKQIWDLQWTTMATSVTVQFAMIGACTAVSRLVIPRFNRQWRLDLWDYNRARRTMTNKFMPSPIGVMSQNLDWIHAAWFVVFYHIAWAVACGGADATLKTRYAIWYRGMGYSKKCSPRWREWKETEVVNRVDTAWQPPPTRKWGNIFVLDEWREKVY
jgi:hypothetical protein